MFTPVLRAYYGAINLGYAKGLLSHATSKALLRPNFVGLYYGLRRGRIVAGQQYRYVHDWSAVGLPAGTIVTVSDLDTTPTYLRELGRNINNPNQVVVTCPSIAAVLRAGGAKSNFTRNVRIADLRAL